MALTSQEYQNKADVLSGLLPPLMGIIGHAQLEAALGSIPVDPHVGEAISRLQKAVLELADLDVITAEEGTPEEARLKAALSEMDELLPLLHTPVTEGGETILELGKRFPNNQYDALVREVTEQFQLPAGNIQPLTKKMNPAELLRIQSESPKMQADLKKAYEFVGQKVMPVLNERRPLNPTIPEENAKWADAFSDAAKMEYSAPHPAEAEAYGEKYTVPSGTENTLNTMNGLDDLLDKQIVISGDNEKDGPQKTSVIAKVTDMLTPQEYAQFSMNMGMIGAAHHLHQKWSGARQDAHIVLEKAVGALSKEKDRLKQNLANPGTVQAAEAEDKLLGHAATILAVRNLSNIEGDSLSSLNSTVVHSGEVWKKRHEIENNPLFKEFAANFKDKTKFLELCASGNGEKLEKEFRSYIKKLPAGKLPNTPGMERYMPTVKERIDVLKKQVKNKTVNSVEAAAEIVALRNLAHAHRGKKASLNMRIPSSALNSLQHVTDLLVNDESFLDMIKRREVKDLLTEGHGGAMIDKIRELSGKGMKLSARAGTIVNQNTYGGRIHELQEQAKILKKQLQSLDEESPKYDDMFSNLQRKYAALLATGSVIEERMKKDHASVSANPPTLELNKKILTVEDSRETCEMAKNFSKEQMLTGLSALSQFAPKDFTVAPEKLNAAEKEAGLNVDKGLAIQ